MRLLDTNIIIRFLTNDDVKLADQAEKILSQSSPKSLQLTTVVFIETAIVLLSVYHQPKKQVIESLALLINLDSISCDRSSLLKTLEIFEKKSISIVDAYLLVRVRQGKNERLVTFDKQLLKEVKVTN